MCGASLSEVWVGSVLRAGPCGGYRLAGTSDFMRLATLQPPLLSPPTGSRSPLAGLLSFTLSDVCFPGTSEHLLQPTAITIATSTVRHLGLRTSASVTGRVTSWLIAGANSNHLETCQLQAEVDTLPTVATPGEATALPVAFPVSEWEIVTEEPPRLEPRPADSGSLSSR